MLVLPVPLMYVNMGVILYVPSRICGCALLGFSPLRDAMVPHTQERKEMRLLSGSQLRPQCCPVGPHTAASVFAHSDTPGLQALQGSQKLAVGPSGAFAR